MRVHFTKIESPRELETYAEVPFITFAGGLALGGNALTSEFKINYLKPAV